MKARASTRHTILKASGHVGACTANVSFNDSGKKAVVPTGVAVGLGMINIGCQILVHTMTISFRSPQVPLSDLMVQDLMSIAPAARACDHSIQV